MALQDILDKINKDFGVVATTGMMPPKERIPFSSPYLNYVTYGGICYGASSEFVGAESSGKSTLALDIVHNFQNRERERYINGKSDLEKALEKAKGKEAERIREEISNLAERKTIYLDLEFTLDWEWGRKLGVDPDKVVALRPDAMGVEVPLDWIVEMAKTPEVGLIIVDSIGSMISGAEEDKLIGESTYGGISKALTRFYKKIMPSVNKHNIALIMINQTRDDMNNPYNRWNRPGGRMSKFAQSLSLGLSEGEKYDEKYAETTNKVDMVYARSTNVQMIKNKTSPPDRQRTRFTILHGRGIDKAYDIFCMACDLGLIVVGGAYYTFINQTTGEEIIKIQGKSKAIAYLRTNPDLMATLWEIMYKKSTTEEIETNA